MPTVPPLRSLLALALLTAFAAPVAVQARPGHGHHTAFGASGFLRRLFTAFGGGHRHARDHGRDLASSHHRRRAAQRERSHGYGDGSEASAIASDPRLAALREDAVQSYIGGHPPR